VHHPFHPFEVHRTRAPLYALSTLNGTVIAGSGDGAVLQWSPADPERIHLVAQLPSPVFALCALGVHAFAAGTSVGELFIVDLSARKALQRLAAHASAIHAIATLGPDRMATAGADGRLAVWMRQGGSWTMQRSMPITDAKLRGLSVSADGEWLALACGDGSVRLLDTVLFNEAGTFSGHEGGANCVAFHPQKAVLLSGGKDGHLRAWSMREPKQELLSVPAHRSALYMIAFDPIGQRCATASRDKTAKVWDARALEPVQRLDARAGGHAHSVNALAWIGDTLITAGDDRRLIRWSPDQNG